MTEAPLYARATHLKAFIMNVPALPVMPGPRQSKTGSQLEKEGHTEGISANNATSDAGMYGCANQGSTSSRGAVFARGTLGQKGDGKDTTGLWEQA